MSTNARTIDNLMVVPENAFIQLTGHYGQRHPDRLEPMRVDEIFDVPGSRTYTLLPPGMRKGDPSRFFMEVENYGGWEICVFQLADMAFQGTYGGTVPRTVTWEGVTYTMARRGGEPVGHEDDNIVTEVGDVDYVHYHTQDPNDPSVTLLFYVEMYEGEEPITYYGEYLRREDVVALSDLPDRDYNTLNQLGVSPVSSRPHITAPAGEPAPRVTEYTRPSSFQDTPQQVQRTSGGGNLFANLQPWQLAVAVLALAILLAILFRIL